MKKNITKSYLFVTELVEEFNSMFHIEKIELKRFDEFKSRDYFKKKIDSNLNKTKGVYLFQTKKDGIIYIGSSGKVIDEETKSSQGIRSRILNGSSPYKLDGEFLKYIDSKSNNYSEKNYRLKNLEIYYYEIGDRIFTIPSVLEHLMIQVFFNKIGRIPKINRKL